MVVPQNLNLDHFNIETYGLGISLLKHIETTI